MIHFNSKNLLTTKCILWLILICGVLLYGCSSDTGLEIGEERIAPNEAEIEAELINLTQQITLARREAREDPLLRRFNQPKTVACVNASIVVAPLSEKLAVGLFATPGRYPAKLRFANATKFDDRDKDLRGLSVKVNHVSGAVSIGAGTGVQDFTLNSYPALFAGTPADFLSFVRRTSEERVWWFFLNPFDSHLRSVVTVLKARDNPRSPLEIAYYSTTPYRHGEQAGSAVKYSVRPCKPTSQWDPPDNPDYLRQAISYEIENDSFCLNLMVQFQTDPDLMPMEDASVIWSEKISPFQKVAQIDIPAQIIDTDAKMQACEAMTFNPWNGHPAHQPLGGINRVRKQLYYELGKFRTAENLN